MIPEMAKQGIEDQTKEKKMLEEWISKHGSDALRLPVNREDNS